MNTHRIKSNFTNQWKHSMWAVLIIAGCSTGKNESAEIKSSADSVIVTPVTYTYEAPPTQAHVGNNPELKKLDSLLTAKDTTSALALIKQKEFDVNWQFSGYGTLLFRFVTGNSRNKKDKTVEPSVDVIRFLLNQGADPNKFLWMDSLDIGFCGGDFIGYSDGNLDAYVPVSQDASIAELLLKRGSNFQLQHKLVCAAVEKNREKVYEAIALGADRTLALGYAFQSDQDFFLNLVDAGADKKVAMVLAVNGRASYHPSDNNLPPSFSFGMSTNNGYAPELDTVLIRKLVARGADPSTPLPRIIESQFINFLDFLVTAGADKDVALYLACEAVNTSMIKMLVMKGAHLTRPSKIVFSENEEIKSILLPVTDGKIFSNQVDLGIHDGPLYGTWLFEACHSGDYQTLEFMLKSGADPNNFCKDCYEGDENAGCETVSALAIAKLYASEEIISLLKKYGAKLPAGCKPKRENTNSENGEEPDYWHVLDNKEPNYGI